MYQEGMYEARRPMAYAVRGQLQCSPQITEQEAAQIIWDNDAQLRALYESSHPTWTVWQSVSDWWANVATAEQKAAGNLQGYVATMGWCGGGGGGDATPLILAFAGLAVIGGLAIAIARGGKQKVIVARIQR